MASTAIVDQDTLLSTTWETVRAQVANGITQVVLPDSLPSSIITTIHAHYSNLINGPVSAVADPYRNIILFTPYAGATSTVASPATASSAGTREQQSKAKIPRPPNAFILYRQHQHPLIKAQYPGIVNNDISKKVATMWKDESEEVKATWKAKADEAKEQHLQQNPGYSYQPRKPSEKKRRVTKRKIAAMSAPAASAVADNNAQQVEVPQKPLPKFRLSPQNPMFFEYTMNDDPARDGELAQMIEQHNNSGQLLINYPYSTVFGAVDMRAFAAEEALVPYERIDWILEEQRTEATAAAMANVEEEPVDVNEAQLMDYLFAEAEKMKTGEQERQMSLTKEIFDWDLFGEEFYNAL